MGNRQSVIMLTDEWITPFWILEKLGEFDLDPCSPINPPWKTANKLYTKQDDGLTKDWFGRVWCNPPYGKHTKVWLEKLADHGSGTALIFARTETKMFFDFVWNRASAILFLKKRLNFHYVDGTRSNAPAPAPSVLISYGASDAEKLKTSNISGMFIPLQNNFNVIV